MSLLDLVREPIRPLTAYEPPAALPPVKLDANESPWPLPAEVCERIARALSDVPFHRYPDARATALRQAVAHQVGGAPDALVLGSGSDEVIALLLTALARPRGGRERAAVLFPEPTFVMFRIAAAAHGLEPIGVPLAHDWQLDVDGMLAALRVHQPNVVFLPSPNNPTGNTFRDEDLRRLIEADRGALFVLDEAYAAFARRSLASWCDAHENVALLGTLSKIGLAAARVGWCRLPADLAVEVDKARQPYNLNTMSQRIGTMALGELAPVLDEHVARIVEERDRLGAALRAHDRLTVFPSEANFFLCRLDGDPDALARDLLADGIAIKSFHRHGGRLAHHLRITVGTRDENDLLLEALAARL